MSLTHHAETEVTIGEERRLKAFEKSKRIFKFSAELEFQGTDLIWAEKWAKEHGYEYNDTHHLLFDAMCSGAIEPIRFREVVSFGLAE